jgi:hypothetical protein
MSKKQIGGFLLGAAAVAAYAHVVRPWYLRWGMRADETQLALPGDELLQQPAYVTTRALTIHAPASRVWQWLVMNSRLRKFHLTPKGLDCSAHKSTVNPASSDLARLFR